MNHTLHIAITLREYMLLGQIKQTYGENKQTSSANSSSPVSKETKVTIPSEVLPKIPDGSILKGEVVDLRSNEAVVRLENGAMLKCQIEDGVELSIGQKANFMVVDSEENTITLKYMKESGENQLNNMIQKALTEAGLANNDKNKQIVKELLNQHMSIDKQSILNVLKQSFVYKEASIEQIISMMKHNIPLTKENVMMYQEYQNHDASILNKLEQWTNNIEAIFMSDSDSSMELNDFLIDILKSHENRGNIQEGTTSTVDIAGGIGSSSIERQALPYSKLLKDILSEEELNQLNNIILEHSNLVSKSEQNLASIATVDELLQLIQGNDIGITTGKDQYQNLNDALYKLYENQDNSLMTKVVEGALEYKKEQMHLDSFMSMEERLQFQKDLDHIQVPDYIKEAIGEGNVNGRELLLQLNGLLSGKSHLEVLLKSDGYQKIMKEILCSGFTLTPKDLTTPKAVEHLYEELNHTMDSFKNLMNQGNNGNLHQDMNQQASHMQDNINFMKSLNEIYPYIQLPMSFKGQKVHSDFYILSKGKEALSQKKNISMLLHLDLEQSGSMDIRIQLDHNQLSTKFYLKDENTIRIFQAHVITLEERLKEKGYQVHSEFLKQEKELDFVQDILENESESTVTQRFSFDIRA